jgi:hypothetical protein
MHTTSPPRTPEASIWNLDTPPPAVASAVHLPARRCLLYKIITRLHALQVQGRRPANSPTAVEERWATTASSRRPSARRRSKVHLALLSMASILSGRVLLLLLFGREFNRIDLWHMWILIHFFRLPAAGVPSARLPAAAAGVPAARIRPAGVPAPAAAAAGRTFLHAGMVR